MRKARALANSSAVFMGFGVAEKNMAKNCSNSLDLDSRRDLSLRVDFNAEYSQILISCAMSALEWAFPPPPRYYLRYLMISHQCG